MNHSEALPVRKTTRKEVGFQKSERGREITRENFRASRGDCVFQREGPIEARDRDWAMAVLVWGTRRSSLLEERSGRCEVTDRGRCITSARYFGARPRCVLETRMRILNLMRAKIGSQCSSWNMKVEMWEYRGRRAISLAAALRTDCRGERRTLGRPMRRELQ